jgi:hypothetical protein
VKLSRTNIVFFFVPKILCEYAHQRLIKHQSKVLEHLSGYILPLELVQVLYLYRGLDEERQVNLEKESCILPGATLSIGQCTVHGLYNASQTNWAFFYIVTER